QTRCHFILSSDLRNVCSEC
ncbi:Histidinol-phosphate aminotransferase, partial [Haemophilus influenzae]